MTSCSKLKIQYYDILHRSTIPVNKYTSLSYLLQNLQINKIQGIKYIPHVPAYWPLFIYFNKGPVKLEPDYQILLKWQNMSIRYFWRQFPLASLIVYKGYEKGNKTQLRWAFTLVPLTVSDTWIWLLQDLEGSYSCWHITPTSCIIMKKY